MAPQWTGLDPELEAIFNDDEPDGPELPRKKVPTGDVYEASRAGDVERLRLLLELGVNVNARDAWDSVALYYACLAGHLDAMFMLLESGAICSENTFDGDRCHYAALNLRVRKLLKAYEARPPPLGPLPSSLSQLFIGSQANLTYLESRLKIPEKGAPGPSEGYHNFRRLSGGGSVLESSETPDVTFYVAGRAVQAHRAILSARSPFFKKKFATDWKHRKEFRFASSKLSFSALFSLIQFFYTDRLDVAVDDLEDLTRVCKVCKCLALQKYVEKEINHHKFASYKAVREVEDSQKRFMLQGSSLPWEEQLHAAMRHLLRLTFANLNRDARRNNEVWNTRTSNFRDSIKKPERNGHPMGFNTDELGKMLFAMDALNREFMEVSMQGCSTSLQQDFEEDHADVVFIVAGEQFRCHRAILGARSEYFKARFYRDLDSRFDLIQERKIGELPVLREYDLSARVFRKLLEYIYTDAVEEIHPDETEEMLDAASRYLLFPLKRAVVDVLLPHLETSSPAELCQWLLMSDMYGVSKLREYCLDAMALNFELFAATPEFRQMLRTLPPPSGDDASRTTAPSAPGGQGPDNEVNILDDLREKWLAIEGGELDQRDESAREFDHRLEKLVEMAILEESENF